VPIGPSFWSTTVPVRLDISGVTVSVLPDAQYEYFNSSTVSVLPEVVYEPLFTTNGGTVPSAASCWVVSEQLHPSPASVHAPPFQPVALKMLATLLQATGTDEIERHEAASGKMTEPVVVVLSVNVPSALATKLPVVCREPFTGTVLQPRLVRVTSMSPDNFRQDDVTFQVPTTLPPQGDTLVQFSEPPELPPVLMEPPLLVVEPPVLVEPPVAVEPPLELGPDAESLPQLGPAAVAASTNAPMAPSGPFRTNERRWRFGMSPTEC
jgi:hypothetical protein